MTFMSWKIYTYGAYQEFNKVFRRISSDTIKENVEKLMIDMFR